MNDFLQFLAQLLDKIPAAFWGIVVGSLFTLSGIFFTNRANDRRRVGTVSREIILS